MENSSAEFKAFPDSYIHRGEWKFDTEELYWDIEYFRYHPEEAINMFSEALRIMDENTATYMIAEKERMIREKDITLKELDSELKKKETTLKEMDSELMQKDSELKQRDLLIEKMLSEKKEAENQLAELKKLLQI